MFLVFLNRNKIDPFRQQVAKEKKMEASLQRLAIQISVRLKRFKKLTQVKFLRQILLKVIFSFEEIKKKE